MAIKKKVWGNTAFWSQLCADTKIQYIRYIFDGGKNVYGDKWWGGKYSTNPSYWVTMTVKDSFKEIAPEEGYSYKDAKEGNMFLKQQSAYAKDVTAVLTGKTFSDFKAYLKAERNGFEFGYPTMGKRVADLRKRGGKAGTLTSEKKPIPTFLSKFIAKEYHNFIKRNQFNKTRVHKGKKK